MARGDYPSAKQDQFVLRLPDGMREQIKEKAEANSRSMNAEIVAAIEAALEQPDLSAAQLRQMLDDERDMVTKVEEMLEKQFDLIFDYRGIVKTANGHVLQQASIIESLCTIILSMDAAPEVVEMAKKLSAAAQATRKQFEERDPVKEAAQQREEIEAMIRKADDLLSPPRK